jgi:exopolysaccharide biosynthesis protein
MPPQGLRLACLCACLALTLAWVQASAPLRALPSVAQRFADWAQAVNSRLVQALPGEPPADAAQTQARDNPALVAQSQPQATLPPPAQATQPQEETLPVYAPGELVYHSDTVDVSITQHKDGGITYYLADVQLSDPSQFTYAFATEAFSRARESVSDVASRHSALLAFNGDFCGFHTEGVIIRGGELFRKQNSHRHLLIVDAQGDLSALTDRREKQGVVAERLMAEGVLHTFEFGPVLVENGQATQLPKSFFLRTGAGYREPRTAIGQVGPLHYLVLVVDGRQDGYSVGCDLPTLQRLFLEHGATFAYNLDGGGSTTLYFQGRVINHPSSGAERRVSDIVMFQP